MESKRLIIVSIPFQRIIRSHLHPSFLSCLPSNVDILIISPFAGNSDFTSSFSEFSNLYHLTLSNPRLGYIPKLLYNLISQLRVIGFWYSLRLKYPYYWATRVYDFQIAANNHSLKHFFKWSFSFLAGFLGQYQPLWRLVDDVFGTLIYAFSAKELLSFSSHYKYVSVIQVSSFGWQDSVLAFYARTNCWRSFFIPYSTDQLYCNGWLFQDYYSTCVQGPVEYQWAITLFNIKPSDITELGSIYLNLLSSFKSKLCSPSADLHPRTSRVFTLLYAGLSPDYFPLSEEVRAVCCLCIELPTLLGYEISIIYRPASCDSPTSFYSLFPELESLSNLTILSSSPSALGMNSYVHEDTDVCLHRLASEISQVDIIVISLSSSIGIEASVFDIPMISYCPLQNSQLYDQYASLMYDSNGLLNGLGASLEAFTLNELKDKVKLLALNPDLRRSLSRSMFNSWNYDYYTYMTKLQNIPFFD